MNPKAKLVVPDPVLGSKLVPYSHAAFTRYVTPADAALIGQGVFYVDINPSDVLPPGLPLPPIPLAFRYPDSDGTLSSTDPQYAPLLLPSAHNGPNENWYYQFAFWLVNGGKNQSPPDRPFGGMPSPVAQVTEDNVVTMAVYDLRGGPDNDTAAWNIAAWICNDHDKTPEHKTVGRFFHVLTPPTSLARDDRANAGLVDTEIYDGVALPDPQQVEAVAYVPPTNPYSIEQLEFSHWTVNYDFGNPVVDRTLILPPNTSGSAIAWYCWVPREGERPEPNIPDPWWKVITRGGLVPPPPPPPWTKSLRDLGAAGKSMTNKGTPRLSKRSTGRRQSRRGRK